MADRRLCPDGGTCHHECDERYAGACWRVWNAGPLSGVFAGDKWPQEVRDREHEKVVGAARAEREADTECRDGDTRSATAAALKTLDRARELVSRGHTYLAEEALRELEEELRLQEQAWIAVRLMLGSEPHVCTCDHSDANPELTGCAEGFSSQCRFELALRKMAGLDG